MNGLTFDDFFNMRPRAPESVARLVLGLGDDEPLSEAGVKALFRFRMQALRPDLPGGAKETRLEALKWARDDLVARIPKPVTDGNAGTSDIFSRNEWVPVPCERCNDERLDITGRPYYKHHRGNWPGHCWPCARDAQLEANRAARLQARSDLVCETCGASFTPGRSDGRYCGDACRQRAYRQRRQVFAEVER